MEIFNDVVEKVRLAKGTIIDGQDAFKLYDTYGFPFDLTSLMAAEDGLQVDGEGFERSMLEQKTRARSDRKEKQHVGDDGTTWNWFSDVHSSVFAGYDQLALPVVITGIKHAKEKLLLVLDKTPFYAESGGQTGDKGVIETARYRLQVADTVKDGDSIIHVISEAFDKILDTSVILDDLTLDAHELSAEATVDSGVRQDAERNHTATHLMHASLRRILGQHVQQKGSFVSAERLRFDFSHFSKLSDAEIEAVEAEVNEQIRRAEQVVKHADVPYDEAIAKGALAFFGDKYADLVRVVEVPGISVELCGGTHVDNIGRIGLVKIVSESSVASGVRRLEAVTGSAAEKLLWNEYRELQQVRHLLKAKGDEPVTERVAELMEAKKELEKQLLEGKITALLTTLSAELTASPDISCCRVITKVVDGVDAETLRQAALALREKEPCAVGLLCTVDEGKVSLVSFASDKAVRACGIDAGKLIREAAKQVQGGGGGKPEFATAGGKNIDGIPKALESYTASLNALLQQGCVNNK